jgi:Polyketide cyclase / dehydrase and lipid transport
MCALSYSVESVIRRSSEDVFEFCSDLRSELEWNPKVKYVEKLTDGPVGVGTRYRARWANSGPITVEVVAFDRRAAGRPRPGLGAWLSGSGGTVTDAAHGARYSASLELQPRGLAWLVAPLALLAMRRQDQKNMHRIGEALASGPMTRSTER